jgi:CheY-like chemotaxis protein
MPEQLNILLIEDDMDDIEFLKGALSDNAVSFKMETLMQGDQIIGWLINAKTIPDIIIMDLNLPKLHGREVICRIKENERFKNIPLIVLTTSSSVNDRDYCINKGADMFISKPSSAEGFKELVENIVNTAAKRRKARS